MMRFSIFKLSLLIGLALCTSCDLNENGSSTPIDNSIDLGSFSLAANTVNDFIYTNKKEAIFVDTTGKELHLFISEEPVTLRKLFLTVPATNTTPKGSYSYFTERKSYLMKNDSFDVRFTMQIETRPFTDSPTSGLMADLLLIFHPNLNDISQQVLYFEVDKRTWPKSYNPANVGPVTIYGKTFTEAYGPLSYIPTPPTQILFNKENGIISFTDELGKLWRFEKFI